MTTPHHDRREAAVFQAILPNFRDQGFEVFLHPDRLVLPPFLHGVPPDAIALKPDRKVAIEIVVEGQPGRKDHRQKLQALIAQHGDWELQIFHAPRGPLPPAPPIAAEATVREILGRILTLYDEAGPVPALLTAWSVFEAAARLVVPNDATWGLPPTNLVELLAERGDITVDEADVVRPLRRLRDDAAHGGLDRTVPRAELEAFVGVIDAMLVDWTERSED